MSDYGLLIDYEYCTGCHSCEVACKIEHDLPTGVYGIKLAEDKPFQINAKTWECKWFPIPTQLCDLCEDRTAKGKAPSCVLHCCAHCIEYGDIVELAMKMKETGRSSKCLYSLRLDGPRPETAPADHKYAPPQWQRPAEHTASPTLTPHWVEARRAETADRVFDWHYIDSDAKKAFLALSDEERQAFLQEKTDGGMPLADIFTLIDIKQSELQIHGLTFVEGVWQLVSKEDRDAQVVQH